MWSGLLLTFNHLRLNVSGDDHIDPYLELSQFLGQGGREACVISPFSIYTGKRKRRLACSLEKFHGDLTKDSGLASRIH